MLTVKNNSVISLLTVIILTTSGFTEDLSSEVITTGEAPQIMMLSELGGVIIEENGKLKLLNVMPSEDRLVEYRKVDLKANDFLVMLNGKRLISIDDLKSVYEAMEIGATLKFGIKRNKDMMIVSFPKGDADNMPQVQMMTMTMDSDDESDGDPKMSTMVMGGGNEKMAALMGTGLICKETENGAEVAILMPDSKEVFAKDEVKQGDQVVSLQGEKISSTKQLNELYDAIKIGEEISFVFSRDGKEFSSTVIKKKPNLPSGTKIIRKHN